MSLVGFRAQNHQQQLLARGPKPDVDTRGTPQEFFDQLHRRFAFTVDACALPENAKLSRFWSPAEDGLAQCWNGERVWCNPPYSSIEPWVVKAGEEVEAYGTRGVLVVMLLPANRTEQRWWQRHIEPYRDSGGRVAVEFLPGRLRFVPPGGVHVGRDERPPFGCCLVVWGASSGGNGSI